MFQRTNMHIEPFLNIDVDTKFVTLIGKPLGQSYAARMQNAAYYATGKNIRYFYTEADSTHLGQILDGIRHMPSFIGAGITKPNKVAVMDYLDEKSRLCVNMGSCNTIVKTPEGKLKGYNSDAPGFFYALTRDCGIVIKGTSFYVMGAGGVGRPICAVLAENQAKAVYVCDVVPENAQALAESTNRNFSPNGAPLVQAVPLGDFSKVPECQVLVNASGVGMGKSAGLSPIPAELIQPCHFCFDACYNPKKTQFLLDAEARGARFENGLAMSLYQGTIQYELWAGQTAPVEGMRAELLSIQEEKAAQDEG